MSTFVGYKKGMGITSQLSFSRVSVKLFSAICILSVAALFASPSFASSGPSTTIVISEVYGAGGNAGSPFTADYVELFNLSATSQTLTGWSIQYASSTSTGSVSAANIFPLPPTVTIPAGGYYLVSGMVTTTSTGLPDPSDYSTEQGTSTGFTLSSASGRVYLVNSTTAVSNLAGTDASVIDFVGYGTAATFEGAGPAPLETNSSSTSYGTYDYRKNVCVDTNNNMADFATAAVTTTGANAPHNSSTPVHPCVAVAPTATGAATPATQLQGMSTLLTVTVTPGTGTSISVTANLGALGGSTTQPLYDDGTHGDATASDNTFSYLLTIPAGQAPGPYTITATVTDTQMDSIPAVSIPLTVQVQAPLTAIHTIQGAPPTTPSTYVGQTVNISGIVTGVRSTGFYIQAKDSDADSNPATPEGIYVNTATAPPTAYVAVGNNVQVTGVVISPVTATGFLAAPLEIDSPTGYILLSTGNALPAPITLTSTNFSAAGAYTQLLAYQSMRMTAPSFTTVSGTGGTLNEPTETYTSNGQFYGVLTGVARPFRAAGVDIRATLPAGAPSGTTRWTPPANVLEVDSKALGGAAIDLTTGAVLTPATGVLDYSGGTPLLMISAVTAERPVVSPGTMGTSATGAGASQLSVAQLNMQRFYNATGGAAGAVTLTATDYARRLRKASAAIRNSLAFPDVVAVQEVENLATLNDLAAQISSDATANSQTDPVYVAYVGTDDSSGLANGFLVKSTKINITGTPVTLATTTTYNDPATGSQPIFDEPPFLLTASVKRGSAAAYPVDVVSAELYPATNINSTAVSGGSTVGASVRAKRMAQAEALASGLQSVIGGSPTTPVVLACSCNAYEFSDGFVDVVGTLRGNPAAANTVVLADTPNIIPTGLTDTTTALAATDRYTVIENGFADALDHILYSAATPAGTTIAAAHIDADFNVTFRNDSSTAALTTPFRTSDHDGLVATLQVPPVTAALSFKPSSLALTFSAQAVGTTSGSKPVVVTNTNTVGAIAITSIVASAGFAQTNNCGTSIAASMSCTINVTFSPTSAGSPTGTLVLTDSDTTGTQTITLTGSSYNLAVSTTTLTAAPAAPVFTQSVLLTATIPGNGTTVPSGTVVFKDGATTLGTGTLAPGATSSTASFTATGLAVGAHSLTAVYSGDTIFATSTGSLTLTVAAVTSATTLSALPTTTTFGLAVALTANVTSNLGVPTGTVQFFDGATALGAAQTLSGGTTTLNTTTLAVGTHSVTAVYSGTTGTPAYPASTSIVVTVTINPAPVLDFTLGLGNTQLIVGGTAPSASTGVVITAINGFASPVSFACSGLPTGSTCSFSPATLTPTGGFATGTMTITSTMAANQVPRFGTSGIALAFTLLVAPFAFRRRKTALRTLALLVMMIAGVQALSGCGASKSIVPTSSTVTVTATATTGQVHTAAITLVVQ
jgi:predicted extracellular nuclease